MIEIPARPHAFRYAADRLALVVIDMQRDFIEPGGFGASPATTSCPSSRRSRASW